jgi:hypothetical protein
MAEPPQIAAVWLEDVDDHGLAVLDHGSWYLLDTKYGRKLTDAEIAGLDHASWHAHAEDLTARIVDHVAELLDKKNSTSTSPRFPWM